VQGTLAQLLAVAIHGNASLQGRDASGFFPGNSTCKFCEFVNFVHLEPLKKAWREVPFAASPQQWFQRLGAAGARGLRVGWESRSDSNFPDRMSVGFVGGGGRWLIEADLPDGCEVWEARWTVGNDKDPDSRIWRVSYGRLAHGEGPRAQPGRLNGFREQLQSLLPQIAKFARTHELENFAGSFDRGLECLESSAPLTLVLHTDMAPTAFLSLAAERLLAAAQAAWVFGAMGSWNDVSFDGKDQQEYESLSERLYHLLNRGAIEAANTSCRGVTSP
jgi:hypothetical protein